MIRPLLVLALLLVAVPLAANPQPQAAGDRMRLIGVVKSVRHHGQQAEIVLTVGDEDWTVRMEGSSQPARAKFPPAILRVGAPVSVYGRRIAPTERSIDAERIRIGCIGFDLRPRSNAVTQVPARP